MLLADELKTLTDKLKAKASQKELTFFLYLINDPLVYPLDENLSEQEQVLCAAFCSGAPAKSELAEKLRGTKPIRGIHYSNNLIELTAFAKYELKQEIEHIKAYAANHRTRDYFILNRIFPEVLSYPPKPANAVDKIASKILTGDLSNNDKSLLFEAVQRIEDLLDVYVVREGYLLLLDYQPATRYRIDLSILTSQLTKAIKRIDAATRVVLVLGIGYLLVRFYVWIIPIIYHSWNEAEPIFAIIESVLLGVEVLILFLIGAQPEKLRFIKAFTRSVGTIVLRLIGINRNEVEERIKEYED
jgi:hypothetical protein